MANTGNARGIIAVDKMGTKVLFLNPATYETEVVLDDFPRTVHELLVVPETLSAAFCNLDRDAQEDLTRRDEDLCAHYP